ncbi:hypothetical protein GLOTRDRAFT_7122, partial [Gloeophyllum trabeum ATCC 11539]
SGFCHKLEAYLRAVSLPYTVVPVYPNSAPKGKVPYLGIDDFLVADSHLIIKQLKERGIGKDLNRGLTEPQQGESRAWQAWVEEVVYPCEIYERWQDDEGWAVTAAETFTHVRWPLRPLLAWYFRRRTTNALWYGGVGRHSLAEVYELEEEFVGALEDRLRDGREYFHGTGEMTEVDVVLYAFLVQGVSQGKGNRRFTELVRGRRLVREYARRLLSKLFPEYD